MPPAHPTFQPSASASRHLHQPPDRAFWLGDLRLECFDEILALPEHAVVEAIASIGRELPGREVFEDLLGLRHASPGVLRHLLLVARFLEQKKTAALEIVARDQIDTDTLDGWRTEGGRLHRLPVAVLLYGSAPENLLALLLWDHWHSRRRVSWRFDGRHRHLPDLELEAWREIAARVLDELRAEEAFHVLQLRAVLQRRETGELLFGFQEPAHLAALQTGEGALVTGRTAGWLLLALYHDGARLDVTDASEERGVVLATRLLAAARGGDCHVLPLRDALDEVRIAAFVEAACDPDDDRLPLLEITARVPGRPGLHFYTLTSPGRDRAEHTLSDLRRSTPFALDWRDVRTVKVGFEGRYRFTLTLAEDTAGPAIWYSDRERDKDVSRRFEDHLRRTMGVTVVPRPGSRSRRRPEGDKAPPRGSVGWWQALLSPIVDGPATWMAAAWTELADEGLVTLRRAAAMDCGTPFVDYRACGVDEHDCAGEIELGWAAVDPKNPMRQVPDVEAICSVCDRVWRPGPYQLPLVERAYVEVHVEVLALRLFQAVSHIATVAPFSGEPGVFEVRTPTGLYFLALVPALPTGTSFAPGQGLSSRTAWIRLDGSSGPGLRASEVLADPTILGAAWGMPTRVVGAVPPPIQRLLPRGAQVPLTSQAVRNRLSLRGKTVYLDEVPVLSAQARSLRPLLAVFVHLAQEDARKGRTERRGYPTQQLLAETSLVGLRVSEADMRLQVKRMNDAARTALIRAGWEPLDLVEHPDSGYRLASALNIGDERESADLASRLHRS